MKTFQVLLFPSGLKSDQSLFLRGLIKKIGFLLLGNVLHAAPMPAADSKVFDVNIRVDASKIEGELTPIWRFFGYDEANYTYMKDGKKLLSEIGKLGSSQVYVRCHHLLSSGDGAYALKWSSTSAYKEDAQGNAVYDWTINDRIFDTYLDRGLKPYAQLGFMPEALSSDPKDYPRDLPVNKIIKNRGFNYPPKDYVKWGELAYQWVKHCVDRYGAAEVNQWYWEVWNEPDLQQYWRGTPEEFFKLYDYAVDGIRRALPTARVGGPEVSGGTGKTLLKDFLTHCSSGTNYVTGQRGTALDFISFHAKGSPKFVDGHVRMAMGNQLNNINAAFALISEFPEYKNLPVIIGESDPEGGAATRGPQNGYRNSTMFSSYTAASFARKYELADKHGTNFEGAITWSFEFEDQPYFAGFRVVATNGIDLPVFNVFRMFSKMSGRRLAVESSAGLNAEKIRASDVRETPDVSALASLDGNKLAVLLWHYHDDDVAGPDAAIQLALSGVPVPASAVTVRQYRIDAEHSNAFEVWKRMGSPEQPTPEQVGELEQAGQLGSVVGPTLSAGEAGSIQARLNLPRQGVSLLVLEWKKQPAK
ncbi:MAG: beta-xylosidase [Verrucomicrobiota bacterium]